MQWFNNFSLKLKFGGFVTFSAILAMLMGLLFVNTIQLLRADISSNSVNALYAKELHVTLLKIDSGLKNLADLEEGLDDADSQMEIARDVLQVLIDEKSSDSTASEQLSQYANSLEDFYSNATQTTNIFMNKEEADAEQYYEQIDELSTQMISETESLMADYLSEANQITDNILIDLNNIHAAGLLALVLFTGLIFGMSILLYKSVINPLQEFKKVINEITKDGWDLNCTFNERRKDEFGQLAGFFNLFMSTLQSVIGRVSGASQELIIVTNKFGQSARQSNQASSHQLGQTAQVTIAVNEMAATLEDVSRNTEKAADATRKASDEATKGSEVVLDTIQAIEKVHEEVSKACDAIQQTKEDSDNIGSVVDVIKGIAEQTNLLALNAAIEAARAGDQGRGFAVVADEVRNLAQRTQQSTDEIQSMVERLQRGSDKATEVMENSAKQVEYSVQKAEVAGASLDSITTVVNMINDLTDHIARASKEQRAVFESINKNIHGIHKSSEEIEATAIQSEITSNSLSDVSANLANTINQFKI